MTRVGEVMCMVMVAALQEDVLYRLLVELEVTMQCMLLKQVVS